MGGIFGGGDVEVEERCERKKGGYIGEGRCGGGGDDTTMVRLIVVIGGVYFGLGGWLFSLSLGDLLLKK
jgi:hypothetical protein